MKLPRFLESGMKAKATYAAAGGAALALLYLAAARPLLMPGGRTVLVELPVIVLLLLGVLLSTLATIGFAAVTGILAAVPSRRSRRGPWLRRTERSAGVAMFLLPGLVIAMLANDRLTYSPPVTYPDGTVVPGSLAALEEIELAGTTQYITIRGRNPKNPVLLFLAGGPGGSEFVKTRHGRTGAALEKHFVVVNWDQPGAGKSWNALDHERLTPELYLGMARELTDALRERFDQEKIYLMGDSWGSALGLWLAERHPDRYHAYIGVDQMIAFEENDLLMYEAAIEYAQSKNDDARLTALREVGPPPYRDNPSRQFMPMNMAIEEACARYDTSGYDLALDNPLAPEYGFIDTLGQLWGLYRTFNEVYPRLYDVDLRSDIRSLQIPVYFLAGRHDLNAFQTLAEDFCARLEAPHKEFHWFEKSGHNVLVEEPDKVGRILKERVLGATHAARTTCEPK